MFQYVLRMGDNALVLAQRLCAWTGHGPVLEEDIALANISLDLFGQARSLLTYAGELEGAGRTEDDLAMKRDILDFTNVLLVEQDNGDFGQTIARQYLFDAFHLRLLEGLVAGSNDEKLRAIAAKSVKEVRYHRTHSRDWLVRLGDGTEESHRRMQQGLEAVWRFAGDMLTPDAVDHAALEAGYGVDLEALAEAWYAEIDETLAEATLERPVDGFQTGGKAGRHGEGLGYLLAEMQFLPRAYPDAQW
ncbi:MAG: 1,2-phenylacetyl-CoA epoxidase subunit PaaC [Myxococcota bacterium]